MKLWVSSRKDKFPLMMVESESESENQVINALQLSFDRFQTENVHLGLCGEDAPSVSVVPVDSITGIHCKRMGIPALLGLDDIEIVSYDKSVQSNDRSRVRLVSKREPRRFDHGS